MVPLVSFRWSQPAVCSWQAMPRTRTSPGLPSCGPSMSSSTSPGPSSRTSPLDSSRALRSGTLSAHQRKGLTARLRYDAPFLLLTVTQPVAPSLTARHCNLSNSRVESSCVVPTASRISPKASLRIFFAVLISKTLVRVMSRITWRMSDSAAMNTWRLRPCGAIRRYASRSISADRSNSHFPPLEKKSQNCCSVISLPSSESAAKRPLGSKLPSSPRATPRNASRVLSTEDEAKRSNFSVTLPATALAFCSTALKRNCNLLTSTLASATTRGPSPLASARCASATKS
mmetsp:Transcript_43613/g.138876  ORF Transcript_43613/g.138876 Transcript_43613/m.138876 type:complete len:287 (-) Transcript_43613:2151-3011(-)